MSAHDASHRKGLGMGVVVLALVLHLLAGCAVKLVDDYDARSVTRVNAIAEKTFALFQRILDMPASERSAAVSSSLVPAYGEIETLLRTHHLAESARPLNSESTLIAARTIEAWQALREAHRSTPSSLSDASLRVSRSQYHRFFRAALVLEEARKLVSEQPGTATAPQ